MSQSRQQRGGLGRGLSALIGANNTQGPSRRDNNQSEDTHSGVAKSALPQSAPSPARRTTAEALNRNITRKDFMPARNKKTQISNNAADIMFGGIPTSDEEKRSIDEFGAAYREIPIDQISTNPKQPRHYFDEEALNELVHSISSFGLMQPIVVRPVEDEKHPYELIMGERRLRASKRAGLEAIPAIVRVTEDSAMLRDALLENIHRVQLNPLEEAYAYQQLLEEFDVSQAELARSIGRSRPVITNTMRLLQLPVQVQDKVAAGILSHGHARAILGINFGQDKKAVEAARVELAERVIAEGMSVRATEEAVSAYNNNLGEIKKNAHQNKQETPQFYTDRATHLADRLHTKVSVSINKKNRGKIVVEFGSQEDFERIIDLLK